MRTLVEDVEYDEVTAFIKSDENLMKKLHEAYADCLDDLFLPAP